MRCTRTPWEVGNISSKPRFDPHKTLLQLGYSELQISWMMDSFVNLIGYSFVISSIKSFPIDSVFGFCERTGEVVKNSEWKVSIEFEGYRLRNIFFLFKR